MAEIVAERLRRSTGILPGVFASVLALIILFPIIAVLWIALTPTDNIWPHLWATVLPRYLTNTLILLVLVGFFTALIGSLTAWLVTIYRFPGRRWLQWALFAPLAIPAYVGAYAITDFLEFAGPVQSALRGTFGWASAADYWFFDVRTRGFAALVLTSVLYPYVYLLTRAALREQTGSVYEIARALGVDGIGLYLRVGLPMARPAVVAGAAIAMMETVADFGVVEFFAVQTLTTGIFTVWLEQSNIGGAAQIAFCAVAMILILLTLERISRRRMRFHETGRQTRGLSAKELVGWRGRLAFAICFVPVAIGFILPVSVMTMHALSNPNEWRDPELINAIGRTVFIATAVALVTTVLGLAMVYSARLTNSRWPRLMFPVTGSGYAIPGAVLALGVMIPLSSIDHKMADTILYLTGYDPGLILTGTAFAIVLACSVRFFAIAQGAADSAMGRIAPSLPMASRSLGKSAIGTLRSVYVPLIRPSIGTALLLVFVDTAKELPITLVLRPFNFDTLATRIYEHASLENISAAAAPSLMVSAIGLVAVLLIVRSNR